MRTKFFILFIVLSAVGVSANADDYSDATKVIRQTINELTTAAKEGPAKITDKSSEDQFYYGLAKQALAVINVELMGKLALGNHWKSASDEQKKKFVYGFERMLVKSYAKQVALLRDTQIEFLPQPPGVPPRKYQIIYTQITFSDGRSPLKVNYSMIKREGWQVFDFLVDGVSIVNQFRQNFNAEVTETSLSALIERLGK